MTDVKRDRASQRLTLPRAASPQQFSSWAAYEVPPDEEVREGIWSLSIPLPPGNPMGYVNCYVFVGATGLTVVDPGWDFAAGREALSRGLAGLGAGVGDVSQILVTHFHADHYGAAPWLSEVSGAPILMHAADAGVFDDVVQSTDDRIRSIAQFLMASGAPNDEIDALGLERGIIEGLRGTPGPDEHVAAGSTLDAGGARIEVLHTPGHTRGHACFYVSDEELLLSGDHILPRISPNVSAYDLGDNNPLGDYLGSLLLLRRRQVSEVLPGHEFRFEDLDARLDELESHHSDRLYEVAGLLDVNGAATSWQVAEGLRWSRPWSEMEPYARRSANGEALAHLILMEHGGRVERSSGPVVMWSTAGSDVRRTA